MQLEDKESLETAEFYNHRFNNFATRSILPASLFLMAMILFLVFAKHEIAVRSTGELIPEQTPISVQTTTGSRIVENRLREGKYVHKGETLLVYHDVSNPAQADLLRSQISRYQQQLRDLTTLRKGITDNTNTFGSKDDKFGYQETLTDYLNQRKIYTLDNQQTTANQDAENDKLSQVAALLKRSLQNTTTNITAYQKLLDAIQKDQAYPASARFGYLFQSYTADRKGLSGDELSKVKNSYIAQIQQQLATLEDSRDTLQMQQATNQQTDTSNLKKQESLARMSSLQASQLKYVADQQTQVTESLKDSQAKLKVLNDQSSDYEVTAPRSGTLHVATELKGRRYIPLGSSDTMYFYASIWQTPSILAGPSRKTSKPIIGSSTLSLISSAYYLEV